MVRTFAALAAALFAAALPAQDAARTSPPPPPDPKMYPALAEMRVWFASGSQAARHCALTGGLYMDADRHYRSTRSESAAADAVMRVNAERLNAAERERLRGIAANVAAMAAALDDLEADSAAIAFSQMCVMRARRPGAEPSAEAVGVQLQAAIACQRQHRAGGLERKECVAKAFRA